MYRIFGLDAAGPVPVGENFWRLVHDDDRTHYRQLVDAALLNGQGFESEFRIRPATGGVRWVHAVGHPEVNEHAKVIRLRGTLIDITERKGAEEATKRSEARFRSLTALSSDWYWEQDEHLRFTEIAGSPFESTRIATGHLIGKSWLDVMASGLTPEAVEAHRETLESREPFRGLVYTRLDADGNTRYLQASGEPVFDATGRFTGYRGVTKDVTMQHVAEARIRQLAHYDDLTGLPNRPLFHELLKDRLTKASRQKNQLAILFIDLDGFKQINDTFGHAAGDRLLSLFAERMRKSLRRSTVVARFAGDEFVVLIDDFEETSQIAVVARKILDTAAEPFSIANTPCYLSASVGISVYPKDSVDKETLIKTADNAMYQAKKAGKGCYHFYSTSMN